MTTDLIIAEKKSYPAHLTFVDGTTFYGKISLTSNTSHVKIQNEGETVWIPVDEITHCSLTIPGSFIN